VSEEKALLEYVLRMADRGYPLPVKFLRTLAVVIARRRIPTSNVVPAPSDIRPPGKNWPQAFYRRHPELHAKRLRPLDWARHDVNIYDKMVAWFAVIRQELEKADVLPENIYNMDETGTQLGVLSSLKVLVRHNDTYQHRGTGVKRTMITAIECISADGRALDPLIIWPASTHRSTWTVHAQPGWHFACSKTGYTDTAISLHWIRQVFDPATCERAQGRPRVLINDGFGTHESLELLQFCFEHNIILCRLPSHTSHKLQPCDVGVFGPLKMAYREQVEQLYRGGANTITKAHFPLLYARARHTAFTVRNVKSSWSKTGLVPFNPERVLHEVRKFQPINDVVMQTIDAPVAPTMQSEILLRTPVTTDGLTHLYTKIDEDLGYDHPSKAGLAKLVHAAEKAFADRSLLLDENQLLFTQNNEKVTRTSTRATIIGTARVMTYEVIIAAEERRIVKSKGKGPVRGNHGGKDARKGAGKQQDGFHNHGSPPNAAETVKGTGKQHRDLVVEQQKGEEEIRRLGLEDWCHVFPVSNHD